MFDEINFMMKKMCNDMIIRTYEMKSGAELSEVTKDLIAEMIDPYYDLVEYMSDFTKAVVVAIDVEDEETMHIEYLKKVLDGVLLKAKKDNTDSESEEDLNEADESSFDTEEDTDCDEEDDKDHSGVKIYLKLVKDANGYPITLLEKYIQERETTLEELCSWVSLSVNAVKKVLFDAANERPVDTLYLDAIAKVTKDILGLVSDDFIDYEGTLMSALMKDGKYHCPDINNLIRHRLKQDDGDSELKKKVQLILEKLDHNLASNNKSKITLKDAMILADYLNTAVYDVFVIADATKYRG